MRDDLDRFDRMLLATESRSAATATAQPSSGWVPRIVPPPLERVVTEPDLRRGNGWRFVDRMDCPMCIAKELGIEFHGELMSGAKVHMIQAHSASARRVANGQPRCLGSGLRVVFANGAWNGVTP